MAIACPFGFDLFRVRPHDAVLNHSEHVVVYEVATGFGKRHNLAASFFELEH